MYIIYICIESGAEIAFRQLDPKTLDHQIAVLMERVRNLRERFFVIALHHSQVHISNQYSINRYAYNFILIFIYICTYTYTYVYMRIWYGAFRLFAQSFLGTTLNFTYLSNILYLKYRIYTYAHLMRSVCAIYVRKSFYLFAQV